MLEIFTTSAFDEMAQNNSLQILVFSLFAGVALSALGARGAVLVRGAEALADLMLQVTNYVMRFAPCSGRSLRWSPPRALASSSLMGF